MFPINRYNCNKNYPLIGGGDFKNILPEIITYITLLVILILEISGPLTQDQARKNLQNKQGLLYLFATFTIVVPIIIIAITWTYEGLPNKKKSKFYGYFGIITFFIVFQFSLTLAALIISKPDLSGSEQGYLYSKIILIFATMIGLSFTQMQIKTATKSSE
jgi:hypothetical protein